MPVTVPASTFSTTGLYTGDASQNRAIPHGLGSTPSLVCITYTTYQFRIHAEAPTNIYYIKNDTVGVKSVTAMDSTNFYVGDGADGNASANAVLGYKWTAFK